MIASSSSCLPLSAADNEEDYILYCSKSVMRFYNLANYRSKVSFSNLRSSTFSCWTNSWSCMDWFLSLSCSISFSSSSMRFYLDSKAYSLLEMWSPPPVPVILSISNLLLLNCSLSNLYFSSTSSFSYATLLNSCFKSTWIVFCSA